MKAARTKLVFAGPTLAGVAGLKRRLAKAVLLPPAAQGHMVAAVEHFKPSAMLLVDGVFQAEPAIRHKEILWVLSRGIAVLGAASMGALRAAELAPYMQGVGFIYRWYRRFSLLPDDAVAVAHGPEETGYLALSESLVDMRMALKQALREELLPASLAQDLATAAQSLGFRERTWNNTLNAACPHWDEGRRQRIADMLAGIVPRQKQKDALLALDVLAANAWRAPKPPPFIKTRAFEQEISDGGFHLAAD